MDRWILIFPTSRLPPWWAICRWGILISRYINIAHLGYNTIFISCISLSCIQNGPNSIFNLLANFDKIFCKKHMTYIFLERRKKFWSKNIFIPSNRSVQTSQNQTLLSHVYGEIWPHRTPFLGPVQRPSSQVAYFEPKIMGATGSYFFIGMTWGSAQKRSLIYF